MKVKSIQMEKLFRLSANGVKLYEQNGIICPQRNNGNGYRVYSENDMQLLGASLQYRGYGFSMQETVNLIHEQDVKGQLGAMHERSEAIEKQIDELNRIKRGLQTEMRRIEEAEHIGDTCELGQTTGVYFLAFRRGGTFLSNEAIERAGAWIARYKPHTSSAVLMDDQWFVEKASTQEPLYGVAVDAKLALDIGLQLSAQVSYLPPRPCIVTTVQFNYSAPDYSDVVRRIRAYVQPRGIALQGGAFIRLTQAVTASDDLRVKGILYAPLKANAEKYTEIL